jgi:L-lactate dehydrogenase complex protein LldG
MSDAQQEMLARIRAALHDAAPVPPIPRQYEQTDQRDRATIVNELGERLRDYQAEVQMVTMDALPTAIAAVCRQHGIARLALPPDLPQAWVPDELTALRDAPPLSHADLDGCDGVLTGCALAIAQTGTIVLDGGQFQGRRALSLVPDIHLCVVRTEQVVGSVPEGIARLSAHATQPITFISGPSATSDIELSRVEGVHGPRTLVVLLAQSVETHS